jgi:hypothetical protein
VIPRDGHIDHIRQVGHLYAEGMRSSLPDSGLRAKPVPASSSFLIWLRTQIRSATGLERKFNISKRFVGGRTRTRIAGPLASPRRLVAPPQTI